MFLLIRMSFITLLPSPVERYDIYPLTEVVMAGKFIMSVVFKAKP